MNNRRKFIKTFAALNSMLGLNFISKESIGHALTKNGHKGLAADGATNQADPWPLAKEKVSFDKKAWARKQNREEIARVYSGKVDEALGNMKEYLKNEAPNDPEVYFGLALAYSNKKMPEQASENFMKAMDNGMEFSRFLAGPREAFETLYGTIKFKNHYNQHPISLVHGPIVGATSDSTAKIWLRTWEASNVKVIVSSSATFGPKGLAFDSETKPENDYTTVVQLSGLQSNSDYHYKVEIDGRPIDATWHFKTLPDAGKKGIFHIGVGGCAAYEPKFERIWETIDGHEMSLFMTLGDNVYIDHPDLPDVQRFCYYQRESVPSFRKLTSRLPYISLWDDHDFGVNDSYGSPELDHPVWKPNVLKVFKENFANPGYGTDGMPGIWYSHQVGDVEFFMLDTRYYRQPSTDHEPSMLGPVQKAWLKEMLKKSRTTFKVIVSTVAWSDGAKGFMEGRIDGWAGYPKERAEIFDFLTDNEISGVVVLAADRHRHDVWKHERPGDYPIYEFTSSRLTNIHYHELMPGALFGYNEKNGFAILTFDTQAAQPYMEYKMISIDDEPINQMRVYLHQVSYAG